MAFMQVEYPSYGAFLRRTSLPELPPGGFLVPFEQGPYSFENTGLPFATDVREGVLEEGHGGIWYDNLRTVRITGGECQDKWD